MANSTQKHGYMKKIMFSIRIGHNKIYVRTHDTYTMQNMKLFTSNVHFNNEIAIDMAKRSPMTSLQVLWPIYPFHKEFIYFESSFSIK